MNNQGFQIIYSLNFMKLKYISAVSTVSNYGHPLEKLSPAP